MPRRRFRRDPVDVSTRLGRYLRGPGGPTSDVGRLRAAWPEVVGKDAARESHIIRLSRAGVAAVACASGAWAQELNLRSDRIVTALRREVPDVTLTGIRFVIGDHAIPTAPEPDAPREVVPTDADRAAAEAETPALDDADLRALVVRARAAQIALERERKSLQKPRKPGRRSRRA